MPARLKSLFDPAIEPARFQLANPFARYLLMESFDEQHQPTPDLSVASSPTPPPKSGFGWSVPSC
ncbi:MAG: hypothetical protein HC780_08070 [Leptolyngbyaceae cyanobacterium CSU_1_3]|nr:hypothetical protein [Leptolyngbyaceae cyanobacterium CSU_1_3]